MDSTGLHVGEPLRQLRGVLTGVPVPRKPGMSPAAPAATCGQPLRGTALRPSVPAPDGCIRALAGGRPR